MANVNFQYNEAEPNEPVRIESVHAEREGGGILAAPTFDVPPTTAVYESNGQFVPIKAYKTAAANGSEDTTIKLEKGSGVAVNDFLGYGSKAVKITAVDKSNAAYDVATVTMGVEIAKGAVLYEAAGASASSAAPKGTPVFVTGNWVYAGKGDARVRLINGANLRKATANVGETVVKLMKGIALV